MARGIKNKYYKQKESSTIARTLPGYSRCFYSPNCREEAFSETEFPVFVILGNSMVASLEPREFVVLLTLLLPHQH